jgi:hypothetical protein
MSRARDIADQQDNLGGAVAPYVAGKNALINGGMDIWQRGTTSASITTTQVYTADRWTAVTGASTGTVVSRQSTSDTTNLPFIQYCARIQRTAGQTGTSFVQFAQSMESVNSVPFAGKTITVSFYARAGANYSSASNALNVLMLTGTGTDQQVLVGYTGSVSAINSFATLTTTWQRFTFTATLATTTNEIGLDLYYTPVGTAGANDYFEVTGIQLEMGSQATPFARSGGTIGGELALCQRYYWRNSTQSGTYALGFAASTTSSRYLVNFPVSMRISPTSLEYGAGVNATDLTTYNYAFTALTLNSPTLVGTRLDGTVASGQTAFRPQAIFGTGGVDFIGFSAEL